MGWYAWRVDMSPASQILYNSFPISAFISSENDITLLFDFKGESLDRLVSIFLLRGGINRDVKSEETQPAI